MFYEFDHGIINLNLVTTISLPVNPKSNSIIFSTNDGKLYVKTFASEDERDSEYNKLKEQLCKF